MTAEAAWSHGDDRRETAALTVIGSSTDHSNPLAVAEIRAVLNAMTADVLAAELLGGRCRLARRPTALVVRAAAAIEERVLVRVGAVVLRERVPQHQHGAIASAVDVRASVLYRSFLGKAEILTVAYRQAAGPTFRLHRHAVSRLGFRTGAGRGDRRISRPVMEWPGPPYVHCTERRNVPEADLRAPETIEHSAMDAWAGG